MLNGDLVFLKQYNKSIKLLQSGHESQVDLEYFDLLRSFHMPGKLFWQLRQSACSLAEWFNTFLELGERKI
jgi:hypothetical protein